MEALQEGLSAESYAESRGRRQSQSAERGMASTELSEGWPPLQVCAAKVLPQEVPRGTASHTLTLACDGVCHAAAAWRRTARVAGGFVFVLC
jgi:hypothetical protein